MNEDLRLREASDRAETVYRQFMEKRPGYFEALHLKLRKVVHANMSYRAKYVQLRVIADQAGADIAPYSVCQRGCSDCCKIALSIMPHEALAIEAYSGIKMTKPSLEQSLKLVENPDGYRAQYIGSPCPFLRNSECSVYSVRPLACRLLHNIGDSYYCDPKLPEQDSHVARIDNRMIEAALVSITEGTKDYPADIRMFFPRVSEGRSLDGE